MWEGIVEYKAGFAVYHVTSFKLKVSNTAKYSSAENKSAKIKSFLMTSCMCVCGYVRLLVLIVVAIMIELHAR